MLQIFKIYSLLETINEESVMNNVSRQLIINIIFVVIIAAIIIFFIIMDKIHNAKDKGKKIIKIGDSIEVAGFIHDPVQDIFYTRPDTWQRDYGYCRLYDEACIPLGMVIESEPIYFEYNDKLWLIEFWKGQYGMTTGCEIGVYTADKPAIDVPGVFKGIFYKAASDEDMLDISFCLKKNGKTLFKRRDKTWWLTGFVLGEFSDMKDLSVNIIIYLKDTKMKKAFLNGLKEAGYPETKVIENGNQVGLIFNNPYSEQPYTSEMDEVERRVQEKNKMLCEKYQEITGDYDNIIDKIEAVKDSDSEIYKNLLNMGKSNILLKMYDKIKKYI